MQQITRVALALVFVLATSATANAGRVAPHRVGLGTGISVAIPDGWMACDPASNIALHNAPDIRVIANFCNSIRAHDADRKTEVHVFVDSDPDTKLLMGSFLARSYDLPEEYIANATPQLVTEFEEVFCRGLVADSGFPVNTCTLHATTFGERPALVGETEASLPNKTHFIGRFYLAISRSGAIAFVFASDRPFSAKAQSVIDEAVGSMKIEPPVAQPPAPLLPITPITGVQVSIPKGWISCDATTDAALGSAPDPERAKSSACLSELETDHIVRMFDPISPHGTMLDVSFLIGIDQSQMAAHMTPDQIAQDHNQDCENLSEGDVKSGLKLVDCQSELGTLSGRVAKVVTLTETGRLDPLHFTTNLKTRVFYVPVGDRLFVASLSTNSALVPDFGSTGEAILNSIAFP